MTCAMPVTGSALAMLQWIHDWLIGIPARDECVGS